MIVSQNPIYLYILQPYMEGGERLDRAVFGVNQHCLTYHRFTAKERIISLITGTLLVTPFLNTLTWLFWQTFGKPEQLSDPDTVSCSN